MGRRNPQNGPFIPMDNHNSLDTIRRELIKLLEADSCGARELSQALHQSEKEIYEHLQHVALSLQSEGKQLMMEPPVCLHCGFVFSVRKRTTPPGRCPKCRRTRISRPKFKVCPADRSRL